MPDFHSLGWVELKITVGEIALCLVTGISAWWVAAVLAKHQTADRALKDLADRLCRDTLTMLALLSEAIDQVQKSSNADAVLGQEMFLKIQRLSNSIHSIEIAASEGALAKTKPVQERIGTAKTCFESLNAHVLDAVVNKAVIDPAQFRQLEGLIRAFRESVIKIQLALV